MGSLSDEDPAIVPRKREENDSDYFESVDAPSASRSRSSDSNSSARKRARKVKSRPRSRRMTSDVEKEGEIGLFDILKGFFQENRSTLKQQNIQNPLGLAQIPNFISKHKVILHYSQICYLRYAKVYQLHL